MGPEQSQADPIGTRTRAKFMSSMWTLRNTVSTSSIAFIQSQKLTPSESLPALGSLSAYNVDDVTAARLWELEANRLFRAVFEAHDDSYTSLEAATKVSGPDETAVDGFSQVQHLVSPVLSALAIYGLDDHPALGSQQPQRDLLAESIAEKSWNRLGGRLVGAGSRLIFMGELDNKRRRAMGDYDMPAANSSRASSVTSAGRTSDSQAETLSDDDERRYHALIDYMTATIARFVASGFEETEGQKSRSYWQAATVAVTAMMSVKMKVLVRRLPVFTKTSIGSSTFRGRQSPPQAPARAPPTTFSSPGVTKLARAHASNQLSNTQQSYIKAYSDMCEISAILFLIMWSVLSDLQTRTSRGRQKDEFDIAAIVYGIGIKGVPVIVYQDRLAEVSGSQTGTALGMARRALDILVESAKNIQQHQHQDGNSNRHSQFQPSQPRFSIEVKTGTNHNKVDLSIQSVAEFISVMVPLSCMDPSIGSSISRACATVQASSTLLKIHAAAQGYTATASLEHITPTPGDLVNFRHQPRSQSLLKSTFFVTQMDAVSIQQETPQGSEMTSDIVRDAEVVQAISLAHLRTWPRRLPAPKSSEHWEISETAITVACLNYTIPVISGCAFLVVGGLLAGFLVGERITGVDPFNLTMFSWIIAGFIVLIAKSVRVAEWPWRDFLLGRVTTRSVRELVSVTGIDEQTILLYLLSIDNKASLVTRGPFNSVFKLQGSDGFSIDVQPTLKTLFAGGIIVLEVISPGGPVLVCLDLRVEVDTVIIPHNKPLDVLIPTCLDGFNGPEEHRDLVFRWRHIRWHKVAGIYYHDSRRVR